MVAPPATSVTGVPAQLYVGEKAAMVIVKPWVTFTWVVTELVQPAADVPIVVYVVVIVGETTTLEPVKAPGFHA